MKTQGFHQGCTGKGGAIFAAVCDYEIFFRDGFPSQSGLHRTQLFKGGADNTGKRFMTNFSFFPVTVSEQTIRVLPVRLDFEM
jgi:hypothetical protein